MNAQAGLRNLPDVADLLYEVETPYGTVEVA
jgi:hypothetical protein